MRSEFLRLHRNECCTFEGTEADRATEVKSLRLFIWENNFTMCLFLFRSHDLFYRFSVSFDLNPYPFPNWNRRKHERKLQERSHVFLKRLFRRSSAAEIVFRRITFFEFRENLLRALRKQILTVITYKIILKIKEIIIEVFSWIFLLRYFCLNALFIGSIQHNLEIAGNFKKFFCHLQVCGHCIAYRNSFKSETDFMFIRLTVVFLHDSPV